MLHLMQHTNTIESGKPMADSSGGCRRVA